MNKADTIQTLIGTLAGAIGALIAVATYAQQKHREDRERWLERNRQELEQQELFRALREGQREIRMSLEAISDELSCLRSIAEVMIQTGRPANVSFLKPPHDQAKQNKS